MNQIFTHPGQPEMQVEVVLASSAPGVRNIYTIRLRYPRIIHAELMTHRIFSRNARSSRAVPVARMIQEVREIPFIPWHWGKNQKGMQAGEECSSYVSLPDVGWDNNLQALNWTKNDHTREDAWLSARNYAVDHAEAFMEAGYHKQIVNRLLEPFMWIDVLVTSTDWANFLWLRDHKDAEPHLQDLARLVKKALKSAELQELEPGEWHLPYVNEDDWDNVWCSVDKGDLASDNGDNPVPAIMCKLSAARCARISYAPFNGDASYERELERYDSLVKSDRVHASPLEHQATPDRWEASEANWARYYLSGNLSPGWIQYRKTVPNEAVYG